jgi:predicted transcriptional regulator of viral defense system
MIRNITLSKEKKIYSTKELMSLGLSYYKINQLVQLGSLTKLNKQYYENNDFAEDDSDFYYVLAYAPEGIICLMSAAVYYNLTTFRPDSVDVAIPKKKRITTLPDWPILNLYYFDDSRLNLGVSEIINRLNKFRIYDIEKTVIDIIYYRNKIGIDETKEILVNYLQRENRNINQLIRYSKQLKCYDILNTYLEVLI